MKSSFKIILLISFIGLFFNSNAQSYNKLIKTANKYYDAKDLTNAEIYYNKALEKKPGDYFALYNLAYVYGDRDEFDTALVLINKSIAQFSYYTPAYEARASIYYELDSVEDALKDIELFLLNNIEDDSIRLIALRAECNFELGKYKIALDDYKWTINNVTEKRWKNFCVPCYNMKTAFCYTSLSEYNNSLKYLDIAINAPDCDQKFICRSLEEKAKIYMVLNEKAKSVQHFNQVLTCLKEINNQSINSTELPVINSYLGNEDVALKLVKEQIANDKDDSDALSTDYYNLTRIYAVLKKQELALQSLETSLSLNPKDAEILQYDIDLTNIRNLPQFTQLIQKYQTNKQK
jgi:tetratricopeptide (TPR) repeat protein